MNNSRSTIRASHRKAKPSGNNKIASHVCRHNAALTKSLLWQGQLDHKWSALHTLTVPVSLLLGESQTCQCIPWHGCFSFPPIIAACVQANTTTLPDNQTVLVFYSSNISELCMYSHEMQICTPQLDIHINWPKTESKKLSEVQQYSTSRKLTSNPVPRTWWAAHRSWETQHCPQMEWEEWRK